MNTENIYECKIYLKIRDDEDGNGYAEFQGSYVKDAIVRPSMIQNCFTDVQSGENYYVGVKNYHVDVGDLYISSDYGSIPFNELTGNTRQNMSKRKVLKKYKEYKEQNRDKE